MIPCSFICFLSCFSSALGHPREKDGACIQMRLSYSPAARLFLFLVQWTDCNLAGALGLLRILIYLVFCLCSFHFHFFYLCNNFAPPSL